MTTSYEFLSSTWAQALGWTLIHSIWQSLIIFLAVFCFRRLTSIKLSNLRYIFSLGGLAAIFLSSLTTFIYIFSQLNNQTVSGTEVVYFGQLIANVSEPVTNSANSDLITLLQANMHFVVAAWFAGTLLFLLRTTGGWFYVSSLKKESIVINDHWSQLLNSLGYKIGVRRWVELASSTKLSAPVVLGYFKPIVLVPVGLFTGLTPAQVETVFLHELMHIKRNDYIVNLIQLILESVFFFNPFVWIISSKVRIEREHCCDDAVIAHHANSLDYARALTRLEEVRIQHTALALSLAGNKYYLLNRIKRIMEKSVKNYSVRDRIIPVALLLVGLVCTSWMIQPTEESELGAHEVIKPCPYVTCDKDTSGKEKMTQYSLKTITTIGPDGKPQEEIIEQFEGVPGVLVLPPDNLDLMMDFNFQAMPSVDFKSFDNSFDMSFAGVPTPPMHFRFNLDSVPEFNNEWSLEFEKAFKEKFADFYQSHQKEIEAMMQDLNEKFQRDFKFNFDQENFATDFEAKMKDVETQMRIRYEKMSELDERRMESLQQKMEDVRQDVELSQRHAEEKIKRAQERMQAHEENMRVHEANQRVMVLTMEADEKNRREFESALREELIKDGYLKKGESLKTINWQSDNGEESINVNGKDIKKSDIKKYVKLQKEYMRRNGGPVVE